MSLGSSDTALRRDECGDPHIVGSVGHIYGIPGTIDAPSTLRILSRLGIKREAAL